MPLCSAAYLLLALFLHRETLIVEISFEGKNQTEDKQNPRTWFAYYEHEELE